MPSKPRKLRKKLTQQEFYCVESRKRIRVPKDKIKLKKDKRGRPRLVAKHQGCELYKYVKFADESKLKKKYNGRK